MKNSNRLMLLGGVVGLMLAAGPAVFADMGAAGMAPWTAADANKDGNIDRAEFDTERTAHFKAIDANGDGFISAEEMKTFRDAHRHGKDGDGSHGDMSAKFLKRLDTSGDGKVTAAEWQADSLQKFVKVDANGDGAVTADELQKMHKRPDGKPGDAAGKGPDGKGLGGDFKGGLARLDTDKDGKVSPAEWNVLGDQLFARLDDNKDGTISVDELPQHRKGDAPQGDAPAVQP